MPKILAKSLYNRLLKSGQLKKSMTQLASITSMDCYFLDALGNKALTVPRQPSCRFIRIMLNHQDTSRHHLLYRQSLLTGHTATDQPIGYIELVHRLAFDEEIVGYLLLSACRPANRTPYEIRQHWVHLARQGAQISWRQWSQCWNLMPAFTPEQLAAWQATLELFAQDMLRHLEGDLHPEPQGLPPLVRSACELIREQFSGPLHLKNVAAQLGVSAEHLSRLFHQNTGLRFREYLAETRISAACDKLLHTDQRISDIAHVCGFSTLSRFNQCFKTHRNLTPRRWRQRERQRHAAQLNNH